jgi:alpha-1,6-mannosyltransferase
MTSIDAQRRASRPTAAVSAWAALGLAGSVLLTLAGARLSDRRVHWWFQPDLGSGGAQRTLFYLGVVGLVVAWLGLARYARAEVVRPAWISAVAFAWSMPLLIGAPLFSHDIYSYLAQGTIAHLGRNPYHYAPVELSRLGQQHVLQGVDPFWRHQTAPYGPLFVGVISLIAGATGSHLVLGATLVRLFDFLGLVLLAVFVPRLARRVGGDPARATWLAVSSPLILLQLVSPGHNDLLMAGLMVVGVTFALEGRSLLGIVVCALAATIKLPALAAALFIAAAWIRAQEHWRERIVTAAEAAAAAVATAAAVTLITGFGAGWISTSLFSTPARVRLAITPATDISYTLAKLLHDAGAAVSFGDVEPVLRGILLAVLAVVALALLARTRWQTLVPCLGLTLAAFAIAGPALWPWYLAWGLVLLATWAPAQRSRVVIAAVVVGSFLVQPDGILLLARGSSPVVVAVWLAIAALAWVAWRRRVRVGRTPQFPEGLGGANSVLAQR